jgi:lambda repressor-like predicted transcriptional regulator
MEDAAIVRDLYKHCGYNIVQIGKVFHKDPSNIAQIVRNVTFFDEHYNPDYIPPTPLIIHFNSSADKFACEFSNAYKQIRDYSHYLIGKDTSIWSDRDRHWAKLKTYISVNGYRCVSLHHNGKLVSNIPIHRLLAESFLENPNNYPYVLHNLDDKTLNTLNDIRWGTPYMNMIDKVKNGHIKRKSIPNDIRVKVEELYSNGVSIYAISKQVNISPSLVRRVLGKEYRYEKLVTAECVENS